MASLVTLERIRAQVNLWNTWREERRQSVMQRRIDQTEWNLWAQLPPERNYTTYDPQPGLLTEDQMFKLCDVYTSSTPQECPICLVDIKNNDLIVSLRCSPKPAPRHLTCFDCAYRWMTKSFGSCPNCRVPVKI